MMRKPPKSFFRSPVSKYMARMLNRAAEIQPARTAGRITGFSRYLFFRCKIIAAAAVGRKYNRLIPWASFWGMERNTVR